MLGVLVGPFQVCVGPERLDAENPLAELYPPLYFVSLASAIEEMQARRSKGQNVRLARNGFVILDYNEGYHS